MELLVIHIFTVTNKLHLICVWVSYSSGSTSVRIYTFYSSQMPTFKSNSIATNIIYHKNLIQYYFPKFGRKDAAIYLYPISLQ